MKTILSSIIDIHLREPSKVFNIIRETSQEIILAGLWRSGFFNHMAFHGGTSLRLFHDLNRFSEDLDFCKTDDSAMDINDVIKYINSEFKSYDLNFRVSPKTRDRGNITGFSVKGSAIDAMEAFGFPHEFMNAVDAHTIINIKIDIDTDTPKGFGLEHMFKTHPFNYSVTILDKPSLFAAKTSAVVSRHWKNRVKGRDLFDFEWYLENNTPINRNYLINNLCREGIISSPEISDDELLAIITNRFDAIDYKSAISDLYPFVDNEMIPVDWSSIHFRELTKRLVFH